MRQDNKLQFSVTPSIDKEEYKNNILSALYEQDIIKEKIKGMLYRNQIPYDSNMADDVLNETFYYLSRIKPDEIIEMYKDKPNRLLGLFVTICKRKCFLTNKSQPNYPKHSLTKFILYTSNFQKNISINPSENVDDDNDFSQQLSDEDVENKKEVWEIIYSSLNKEQLTFLTNHFNLEEKERKSLMRKKEYKKQYEDLVSYLTSIFKDKNYNVR